MSKEKQRPTLRTSMFGGFRKNDVVMYLKQQDSEAFMQVSDRDEKIESLNREITALNSQVAEIQIREQELVAERELISQTLVTAKETANKMIADAQIDVAKKKAEFQQNYSLEINKLATIRNEVIQLRKFATDAIRSFERELSTLERSTIE